MGVKTSLVEQRWMRLVNLIEFCHFAFTSSYSKCSFRQFNVCLFVSLITVTVTTKTDQDASVWEQRVWYNRFEDLLKAMALTLRYFSSCEPIQPGLDGELKISLWS